MWCCMRLSVVVVIVWCWFWMRLMLGFEVLFDVYGLVVVGCIGQVDQFGKCCWYQQYLFVDLYKVQCVQYGVNDEVVGYQYVDVDVQYVYFQFVQLLVEIDVQVGEDVGQVCGVKCGVVVGVDYGVL